MTIGHVFDPPDLFLEFLRLLLFEVGGFDETYLQVMGRRYSFSMAMRIN